jgi:hypothetical protein
VAHLTTHVPSVHALEMFIPELKEKFQRRLAMDVGQRLITLASEPDVPPGPLLEDAEEAVKTLRRMANPDKPLTVRNANDLLEQSLPQNDHILGDRLLARGQSLTILGAGGLGKSRLLLQLAASCIAGRPFLQLRTHAPGSRWLVLQTENSNRRLQQDLQALRQWLGDQWEEVGRRLLLHTVEHGQDSFVQLNARGAFERLSDVIEEHAPDVICFDPLNCFGAGELNNDGDMRAACQAITQLCHQSNPQRAIIVLHHALTGRFGAARATGFERSSFGRNSKLLHAWTRGQINVAPAEADNNSSLVISCGKCSNGEEFGVFGARLNPSTLIYEADPEFNVAAWEKSVVAPERAEPVDVLLTLCAREPLRRKDAVEQLLKQGISRATAYRAVQEALQRRWIQLHENGTLQLNEEGETGGIEQGELLIPHSHDKK